MARERRGDPGGLSLSVTLENYEAARSSPLSLSREGHGEGGQVDGIRLQVAAAQNSPPAAKSWGNSLAEDCEPANKWDFTHLPIMPFIFLRVAMSAAEVELNDLRCGEAANIVWWWARQISGTLSITMQYEHSAQLRFPLHFIIANPRLRFRDLVLAWFVVFITRKRREPPVLGSRKSRRLSDRDS